MLPLLGCLALVAWHLLNPLGDIEVPVNEGMKSVRETLLALWPIGTRWRFRIRMR